MSPAPRGAAEWLGLAAAPTFAAMAVLSAFDARPETILCSTAHASPLSGMVPMYVLMSLFHASPWLKRLRPDMLRRT